MKPFTYKEQKNTIRKIKQSNRKIKVPKDPEYIPYMD